jgi:hypothetical protein
MEDDEEFTYDDDMTASMELKQGTQNLAIDEALAVDSSRAIDFSLSRDKLAVAIYIKTMRVGLEHAYVISKNRAECNALFPPVSLCCRSLLRANVEAQLVANSIPDANRFQLLNIKVHQGEMFSLVSSTKNDFSQVLQHGLICQEVPCQSVLWILPRHFCES